MTISQVKPVHSHVEEFASGATTGFLHVPAEPRESGVVLTHGAGATCESPLLVTIASALAAAGFSVLRFDLSFRKRKKFGPPHPATAADDRRSLQEAAQAMRGVVSGAITLGGHSYGGRQASMLMADEGSVSERLLLLSYPLHPPAKPAQVRTAHFPRLRTPCLFVHGAKDPFGTLEEMEAALRLVPDDMAKLSVVEGAGHDLKRGKFDVESLIVDWLRSHDAGNPPLSKARS